VNQHDAVSLSPSPSAVSESWSHRLLIFTLYRLADLRLIQIERLSLSLSLSSHDNNRETMTA
jgi:hypothetical protein